MFHTILAIHLLFALPSHAAAHNYLTTMATQNAEHRSESLMPSSRTMDSNPPMVGDTTHVIDTTKSSDTFSDTPITASDINFPGLGGGLKKLIGSATGILTEIAMGFFGLLLGLAVLAYAWNHNNPKKLQESRAAIMRVLEACAMFGLIGVLLGIVHSVVAFAS